MVHCFLEECSRYIICLFDFSSSRIFTRNGTFVFFFFLILFSSPSTSPSFCVEICSLQFSSLLHFPSYILLFLRHDCLCTMYYHWVFNPCSYCNKASVFSIDITDFVSFLRYSLNISMFHIEFRCGILFFCHEILAQKKALTSKWPLSASKPIKQFTYVILQFLSSITIWSIWFLILPFLDVQVCLWMLLCSYIVNLIMRLLNTLTSTIRRLCELHCSCRLFLLMLGPNVDTSNFSVELL